MCRVQTQLTGRAGPIDGLAAVAVADGTVLAVRDLGPRHSTAPTVVLVHGWTQDHTSWEDVAELLSAQVRTISYDARGHGRSDAGPRGSATIEQLADDLADVLAQLVPTGPVVLAGHSLGGPVIMAFAERHPDLLADRVGGIALAATSAARLGTDLFGFSRWITAPAIRIAPVITGLRARSRARVNTHFPRVIAEAIRYGLYGPGQATAENRRRTAAQVARCHPETTVALVDAMLAHDRIDVLHALRDTPTVVLAGTKDALCPMAHSRAIAEALPHADFVVYPNAGHMLPYERADEVAGQILGLAVPQSSHKRPRVVS